MSFQILHVDDDRHIRDIVDLSLGLDSTYTVISCGSADEALATASERPPDLILCDVMMPGMDGMTMLARLRENATTAKIPVIFMTARSQAADLEQLKALGAAVITKPFDPMKLADTVRGHLQSAKFVAASDGFVERMRADATLLSTSRETLRRDPTSLVELELVQSCAHRLAGTAGVFGFEAVSNAASILDETIIAQRAGLGASGGVESSFDALMKCLEREIADLGGARELVTLQGNTVGFSEPRQGALRLVISDDDPAVVKLLASRLKSMGFEVQTAINGIQALITARRNHADILIVDVNMPGISGLDVSARLLDPHCKPIEVVVMTGSANPETIERCESLGAFYLRKGPEFWSGLASALIEIAPNMAEKINELAMLPIGAEVRTRPRVLIVDDDRDVEVFYSSRLRKLGVDTLYAADGVQGYRIACKDRPSAIISDCFMQNGDAHYLLSRLRITPGMENIPVFVISGQRLDLLTEQKLAREICGRPGAARIFRKSFNTDELFGALQEVCGFEVNLTSSPAPVQH
jgi:CheY-like chemotaxis protein